MDYIRKQHFIPRMYLKGWVNSAEKIYAVRNGKAFFSGLMGIAHIHNYYRLLPISIKEKALIYKSIDNIPESMRVNVYNLIGPICDFCLCKTIFEDSFLSKKIDIASNNVIEKLLSFSEGDADKYLIKLRNGDAAFWKNNNERLPMLIFIFFQYFRTPKREYDAFNSIPDEYKNCWPILQIVLALNLVYSSEWILTILINNTNNPFVTSDNPTINLDQVNNATPMGNKIYMPISPKYAIIIENCQIAGNVVEKGVQEEEVISYNNAIQKESLDTLFFDD